MLDTKEITVDARVGESGLSVRYMMQVESCMMRCKVAMVGLVQNMIVDNCD